MSRYVLALDQGTTSSRAILFDNEQNIIAVRQREFEQLYPQQGWVEHDPMEIWSSQYGVMNEVVAQSGVDAHDIAAIGITNQRETTILWEKATGRPIYNAIVWQCRRTAPLVDELLSQPGMAEYIKENTGLVPDAYFSATKIKWILDHVPGARERAQAGEILFGTVDSWLVWNLTGGYTHVTDVSNASRTMLFNIHTLQWDEELLELMGIPRSMMPEVKSSSEIYGQTALLGENVPVAGIAGDQQAALFGQLCLEEGDVKNTYGTGCFLLMNTGNKPIVSENQLLTTVAWKLGGQVTYALEGSIFVAGSVVQWLRDSLGIIGSSSQVEELAAGVQDNGGVYFVPALTGLGAPYWDQYAKGSITGITRGTTAAHIARAALEGIAFQTMDIVSAMQKDAGVRLASLKVDGGASRNNLLMQFQADLLGASVVRPEVTETTALGAAYLAGLAVGFWSSLDELRSQWKAERVFSPEMPQDKVEQAKAGWAEAVGRTLTKE